MTVISAAGSIPVAEPTRGDFSKIAEPLVSILAPTSLEADQYRALRHVVERLRRDSGLHVLAVTSPGPGDGKSVTTINLAASLAQSRRARTLLIDADLHRSSVAEYLGIAHPRAPGLVDAILNEAHTLDDLVHKLEPLNLCVLTAGMYQVGTYELLNSPRMEVLLEQARAQYEYIIVDTPPLLPLPDCRLLGRCVDGFLIVVAAHKTPRKVLMDAVNLVDPAKVIGTVFNGDNGPLEPYAGYYSYYTRPPDGSDSRNARRGRQWWRRALKRTSPHHSHHGGTL